ncbi:MAG: hypothetical protein P4L69_16695 [Desulfosporosinus sp.]|nr:hypothetical protein [Desulfosporosinus sp.]
MRRQCLRATGTLGHPWPADGAFGETLTRVSPRSPKQELERLVCSAS